MPRQGKQMAFLVVLAVAIVYAGSLDHEGKAKE